MTWWDYWVGSSHALSQHHPWQVQRNGIAGVALAKLRLVPASAAMLSWTESAVAADVTERPPAVVEANYGVYATFIM